MDFQGKTIVVTGAANGIGKEAALQMGRKGGNIALVDVDEAGATAVARQIEDAGGQTRVLRADLADVAQIRAAIERSAEAFGRLDGLACVAAIYPTASITEVTGEFWDRVHALDLRGVFFTCQAALKLMLQQGSGAIVNVASGAAFRPIRNQVVYSAAKGGVVSMSRVLALEGAKRGVRVNVVAPGPTASDTIRRTFEPEHFEHYGRRTASGRWMAPAEVAEAITFLLSDAASGINGAIVNVNGGDYMPSG